MLNILIGFLILLTHAVHPLHELLEGRDTHRQFHAIISESDHCNNLRHNALFNLHSRNYSSHIALIQKDLFEKYQELLSQNLPDAFVEPLLGLYCKAKSEMFYVRNTMRPPAGLRGNFTWYFDDDVPENHEYHMAKFKEQVFLREFETRRKERINEMRRKSEHDGAPKLEFEGLKSFYRTSAFIIVFSLAMTIQNVLRMYYAAEDEEEEVGNMRAELAQIAVLSCSLICILVTLHDFP